MNRHVVVEVFVEKDEHSEDEYNLYFKLKNCKEIFICCVRLKDDTYTCIDKRFHSLEEAVKFAFEYYGLHEVLQVEGDEVEYVRSILGEKHGF